MKNRTLILLMAIIAAIGIWFLAKWFEQQRVLTNYEKCINKCLSLPGNEEIDQEYHACLSGAKAAFFNARTACAPLTGFDRDQCFDAAIEDYSNALTACMNDKTEALNSRILCIKGCVHQEHTSTLEE